MLVDVSRYDRSDLSTTYRQAFPFPHAVLEDILRVESDELAFPPLEWDGWTRFSQAYGRNKHYCFDITRMPTQLAEIIHEMCGPGFLDFLTEVTGIEKLIPDPYLQGGGLHCSGPGGKLSPHTDFHRYDRLNLYRRVNVLLYLNPCWHEKDGGELLLFVKGRDEPSIVVPPRFGTCVIFNTDDRSVHGVRPIAASSDPRRSLALYYYTSGESDVFSGDYNTYWQEHERDELSAAERRRLRLMKAFLRVSRTFSHAAFRVDPNRDRG